MLQKTLDDHLIGASTKTLSWKGITAQLSSAGALLTKAKNIGFNHQMETYFHGLQIPATIKHAILSTYDRFLTPLKRI